MKPEHKTGLAWLAGVVITIGGAAQAWRAITDFFDTQGWPSVEEFEALRVEVQCLKFDRRLPGLRNWLARAEDGSDSHDRAEDALETVEEDWDRLDCPKVLTR